MKKFFIIFGISAAVAGGSFFVYRKWFYVPDLTMTFEPDWNAKTVKYNVFADGKNYISGTASLNGSPSSGSDYGKWKLEISRYASMPNIPGPSLTFELTAKGKSVLTKVVNFDTKTIS